MKLFAETRRKNVTIWYRDNPGKSEKGNNRPEISGILEIPQQMVKKIIENGEVSSDEIVQLRFSAWKIDSKGKAPTHRGNAEFSLQQKEEFKRTA